MNIRKLHLSFALTIGLLTLVGLLALLWTMGSGPDVAQAQSVARSSPFHATAAITRYVSSVSGNDTGDCTDDSAPCQTIQYAVDQANDGDEIRIATRDNLIAASYTGSGSGPVISLDKSVTLRGGYIYAHTTVPPVNTWTHGIRPSAVDGEGERRALYVSGDITPTLRMLSFVNGYADRGGNVYAEDANVRFIATPMMSGTATYGGGLYLKNCQASFDPGDLSFDFGEDWLDMLGISGLLLVQNNTAQYGGGIYVEEGAPILAGLAVYSNVATADGGGIYLQGGRPTFAGGLVLENQAGDRGGGFLLDDSVAYIAVTAVYSNTAADGAGFYLDGPLAFSELTMPIIANNYVRYNRCAGSQGGGFYFYQAIAGLVNNVVADNQATDGAGLYLYASSPQLFHNTIARNAGSSGIYLTHKLPIPSQPFFTNTIVVSHTVGVHVDSTGIPLLENRATLKGTLWWDNDDETTGAGEIIQSADVYGTPRFKCTGGLPGCVLPYHLEEDSAAVDAGVVPALSIPGTDLLVDIDGQLRPSNGHYDIGADEVVTRSFDVWFMPPLSALIATPGQTVTHTHQLMNTGLQTDTYDLGFRSSSGWATLLTASPIALSAQTSVTVQVQVTVPGTATNDMRDTSAITATSHEALDRQGYALDVTSVVTSDRADLAVGKWADAGWVEPGESVRFTLVVTNAGPLAETLAVTLTDIAVPAGAIDAWSLPDNCTGGTVTGMVTCTLTLLEGTPPVTATLDVGITTTGAYSGLLINTVSVNAAVLDPSRANNTALTVVDVGTAQRIYLPIVMRDW